MARPFLDVIFYNICTCVLQLWGLDLGHLLLNLFLGVCIFYSFIILSDGHFQILIFCC